LKALQLRLKAKDFKSISESYYNLGDFYYYSNDLENAHKWYVQSLETASNYQLKSEQNDALNALAELSKTQNDFESANKYREKQLELLKKIEIDNRADEEEIKALQLEMLQLETNSLPISNEQKAGLTLKWEWGVIALLLLLLLMKTRINSSFQDISNEK
jgi:tetratricopeptide (TPR) repeat protein